MNTGSENTTARYGFVVLHYMAYDMTEECVSLLLTQFGGTHDIHVVIVDNASPNGSGSRLEERYKDHECVTVLVSSENLGFARGNNLGYRYLVEYQNPDYIIVMNNDVLIEQPEFLDLADTIYQRTGYAVLGPDIYSPKADEHQNTGTEYGATLEEVRKRCRTYSRYYERAWFYYHRHVLLRGVANRLRHCHTDAGTYREAAENVMLHGACYIFSRKFMEHRPNCFNPNTFMYGEEDILYYECMRLGLRTVYSPELHVLHMEDVATNAAFRKGYERWRMQYRNALQSAEVLRNMMERDAVSEKTT